MSVFSSFRGIGFKGVYGVGWKKFCMDLYKAVNADKIFSGAAALGYYFTLAIFPALIFLLSLLPHIATQDLQDRVFTSFQEYLPQEVATLLTDNLTSIISQDRQGLLSIGALLTLWAASAGVYAIMLQLDSTYGVVKERRSYLRLRGVSMLLTIGFGLLVILAFMTIILGETVQVWMEQNLAWGQPLFFLFALFRWIIVPVALALAIALVYYFGPDVKQDFKFITPGSLLATVLLILVTLGFNIYVENFGHYNATYGSIGAVIILMLWLNILGLLILLGSEVNLLIERYSPEGAAKLARENENVSMKEIDQKQAPPRKPSLQPSGAT